MVLQLERPHVGKRAVLVAGFVAAAPFQRGVVLQQHAIAKHGEIAGVQELSVFVNRAAENNVINLPLTGLVQRIGQRRIHAVDRAGKTVGIGRIVIVVEHLHLHLPHEEDAAIAATLADALDIGGLRPLDMELAVGKLLLGADITGARHTLQRSVFDHPLRRLGGSLVGLPLRNDRVRAIK